MMRNRSIGGIPWAVVAAGFIPRLLVFGMACIYPTGCVLPDSFGYMELAQNIVSHHSFSSGLPLSPEAYRLPGYPLFLALFRWLTPNLVLPAAFTQTLLGGATVVVIYKWLADWTDERSAILGSLVVALDVVTIFHTPMILAETWVNFLAVCAIYFSWQMASSWRESKAVASGLLWGLTIMVKPVFILMPIVFSAPMLRRKKLLILFLFTAYLLPAAWMVRNAKVFGAWTLTPQGGLALMYPAASVQAAATGQPWDLVYKSLQAEVDAAHPDGFATLAEKSKAYGDAAKNILREHPFLMAQDALIGVARTLAGTGVSLWFLFLPYDFNPINSLDIRANTRHTAALLRQHKWLIPIHALYAFGLAIAYLGFTVGVFRLWRGGYRWEAWLLGTGVLYLLLIASHQGYSRFRIPAMPFFAGGLAAALSKPSQRKIAA